LLRSQTCAAEVVRRKRSADSEAYLLRVILRHPIPRVSLHRLTASEIAKHRDHRQSLVKADTMQSELAIFRHCIEVARNKSDFALPTNLVQQVKLSRAGNPRERRVNTGELEKLLATCETSRCRRRPAVIRLARDCNATERITWHPWARACKCFCGVPSFGSTFEQTDRKTPKTVSPRDAVAVRRSYNRR
jgi:hypothetical protein